MPTILSTEDGFPLSGRQARVIHKNTFIREYGVFSGYDNELEASYNSTAGNLVKIDTGAGYCGGVFFENTEVVNLTIIEPINKNVVVEVDLLADAVNFLLLPTGQTLIQDDLVANPDGKYQMILGTLIFSGNSVENVDDKRKFIWNIKEINDDSTPTLTTSGRGIQTNGGNIYTNSGEFLTGGGPIFTSGGRVNTGGGFISTVGGNIFTNSGFLNTAGGEILTIGGNINTLDGNINVGGKISNTAGDVEFANTVNVNGTNAFYRAKTSLAYATSQAMFRANWKDGKINALWNIDRTGSAPSMLLTNYSAAGVLQGGIRTNSSGLYVYDTSSFVTSQSTALRELQTSYSNQIYLAEAVEQQANDIALLQQQVSALTSLLTEEQASSIPQELPVMRSRTISKSDELKNKLESIDAELLELQYLEEITILEDTLNALMSVSNLTASEKLANDKLIAQTRVQIAEIKKKYNK